MARNRKKNSGQETKSSGQYIKQINEGESYTKLSPVPETKDFNKGKKVVDPASFVGASGLLDYGEIAFGSKQTGAGSPLITYPGFVTQIPFNSTINSTLIQNGSPIPVTVYYQITIAQPNVYQATMYLITTIISRIGERVSTDERVQEFTDSLLKRIGKVKLFQSLLTAFWAGFAVLKVNWGEVKDDGSFKPYIDELGYPSAKSILALPPDSILMAVTPEGELDDNIGILQYYYNVTSGFAQNYKAFTLTGTSAYASYGSNMTPQRSVGFNPLFISALPKAWRIVHTHNPTGMSGNHYGESGIRPIFKDVMDLNNLDFKIQIAATYKAYPFTIFSTDSQTVVQTDTNGTTQSLNQNVSSKLGEGSKKGFMVVDGLNSVQVQTIDNSANFEHFVKLRDSYIANIRAGLCFPDMTGNSGSFANAMANNESVNVILDNILKSVVRTVDEFMEVAIDNAMDNVEDYGHFEILDNSLDDKAIWSTIFKDATTSGFYDPTNLDDVNMARKKFGFPLLD